MSGVVFPSRMSPRKCWLPLAPRARALVDRLRLDLADQIRSERRRRGWTIAQLATEAGVSAGMAQGIEGGEPSTLEGYVRLAVALGLQPEFLLRAERAAALARLADPVHGAMGDAQAERMRRLPLEVRLDEPYQHYQFAGRADLVAIDRARRALLHIENRTRFPNLQEFAGSWNAKKAYLA